MTGSTIPSTADFADEAVTPASVSRSETATSVNQVFGSEALHDPQGQVAELARHYGVEALLDVAQLDGYQLVAGNAKSGGRREAVGPFVLSFEGRVCLAVDPSGSDRAMLETLAGAGAQTRHRVKLIAPEVARHLRAESATQQLDQAIYGLARTHKGLSAMQRTSYPQMLFLAFVGSVLGTWLWLAPVDTIYRLGIALNFLFFAAILLRVVAAMRATVGADPVSAPPPEMQGSLPVYTILVPLYREANIVPSLIRHLLALDYPPQLLDIKLIFEADDRETFEAARACSPPACFEFVLVPPAEPRTKPKALNYALQRARGRYVVVYDAEDRPEPDQLKKAVATFADGSPQLACLQARLNYYNPDENWLSRQFTIEYTALFDGMLPALQRFGLPMPLGGTSNHFKIEVLRALAGWDAFNVTEDADLGIRLYRFGYRCRMLPSTTYEEACCELPDWLKQRTRWLKGWLQTYFVHMRRPLLLARQLGIKRFIGVQIVLGTQVLSLIAHPLYILFMVYAGMKGDLFAKPEGIIGYLFWGLAANNFLFGYLSAIWLGAATLPRRRLKRLIWQLPSMPLYWLLMSIATMRALVHYVTKPFYWEKTKHGQRRG